VAEATELAGRFMPPTLTSGRERRPHSHWWLISPEAKTDKFKDVDGTMLLELRSTGCQTIVAPSIHLGGDRYVCHGESGLGMAHVEGAELRRRLRELATAVLIARHLPKLRNESTGEGGGRHDYALALSGFLLRSGRLDEPTALRVLRAAWDVKGWPDERSKREAHHDLEGIVHVFVPYSQTLLSDVSLEAYFKGHESGSRHAWTYAGKTGAPPAWPDDGPDGEPMEPDEHEQDAAMERDADDLEVVAGQYNKFFPDVLDELERRCVTQAFSIWAGYAAFC
jgi:hypothetical protein